MVVICFPVAAATGVTQERIGRPSTCTVQAPHSAMPQPNLVPVRPITSRSTHKSGMSAGTSTVRTLPLMLNVTMALVSEVSYGICLPGGRRGRVVGPAARPDNRLEPPPFRVTRPAVLAPSRPAARRGAPRNSLGRSVISEVHPDGEGSLHHYVDVSVCRRNCVSVVRCFAQARPSAD